MVGNTEDVLKVSGQVGVFRGKTPVRKGQGSAKGKNLPSWGVKRPGPNSGKKQDSNSELILPTPVDIREEPHGDPPVWAENRIVLGDALPWFRAVQGGCYYLDNICRGVLIDEDGGDRSYIDDEIVITRVGGAYGKTREGKLLLMKDHDTKSVILRSLLNSMKFEIPVGVILGRKNATCRIKVPHNFNVLGFFRITDIWFEQVGKYKGAQMRFEKIDLTTKSWWSPKGSPDPIPLENRVSATTVIDKVCPSCSKSSPKVYRQGWMCLSYCCPKFWILDGSPAPLNLDFAQEFLAKRSNPINPVQPHVSLVPDLLSTFSIDQTDVTGTRVAWKGIVCRKCKACIARIHWRFWECSTNGCGSQYHSSMNHVSLRSVLTDTEMGASGHRLPTVPKETTMMPTICYMKNYRQDTFVLQEVGIVRHFAANRTINSRPRGPDYLFNQLQAEELGLKRYPIQPSVVEGTLTSHFAVNFGMPYKYIVSVDSRPFSTAPPVIISALERLKWAVRQTVMAEEFQTPNELLVLGYFEDMSINYHDDGETSLGPTIATLSLGAPATMLIRMKDKYYHGYQARDNKRTYLTDDPVVPGCANEKARRELVHKFREGVITATQHRTAREALPKEEKRHAPPVCSMALNHGDLVVMHGSNLQKYFEHCVIPSGRLRFALTARYVMPNQVPASEHWKGDYDLLPEFEYDGDE